MENNEFMDINNTQKNNGVTIKKRNTLNNKELSYEEKIDYVYKYVKNKQDLENFKNLFKASIILGIIYLFVFALPNNKNEIKDVYSKQIMPFITTQFKNYVSPIVKDITSDIVGDMTKNMEIPSGSGSVGNIDVQNMVNEINKTLPTNVSVSNAEMIDISKLTDAQKKLIQKFLNK